MKKGETRKTKSIEFVIDVPIGSVKDEPEDNSREWPGKRRLVAQILVTGVQDMKTNCPEQTTYCLLNQVF